MTVNIIMHTRRCVRECLNCYPMTIGHPIFQTAKAMIYCGLTDEEALRVASRHNVNGHFNHLMTHHDYVG